MSFKIQFSILLVAIAILSSCSNYGYISENDVYMQAPTEINLEENENDLTSFNAFKAREKGAFRDEYIDPRLNERVRMNQFMIFNSYNPYYLSYRTYANQPIRFHGMGMYNSFYGGYGFMGPTFGYGLSSGFGMGMYGNGYYSPFYPNYYGGYYSPYGYGYNPYYYGGGHYNGIVNNSSNSTVNQPVHYGKRTTLTSSSNRSSSYNKNYTKQVAPVSTSTYNVNDQTLGTSRREVSRRYAGSGDYSNNGKPNNSNYKPNQNGVTHQRAVNQNYAPNSSARRSGAVQTQRSINVNSSRGSGSVNSSPSQRTSSPSLVRPQSRGSFSTGSSPRGSSSPSTTRSSGSTNSSSGRR